jgi:uncharacterized protein YeeX (DUF496 family)
MSSEINQEYVNHNIEKIVDFMIMCEPDKSQNKRNWKHSLLKDYKPNIRTIVAYQKYTEGINMKKIYEDRVDKFYDREQELNDREKELDQRTKTEESISKNLEQHEVNWRKITQSLTGKLRHYMSHRDYFQFIHEEVNYHSYFGL